MTCGRRELNPSKESLINSQCLSSRACGCQHLSEAIILPLPTRDWLRKTQSFSDSTRTTNSSDTVFVTLGLTIHREQVSEKECFAVVDTYLCPSFESHPVLACDSGTIEVLLRDGTAPLLCLQILTPRSREEMGYQCLLARS